MEFIEVSAKTVDDAITEACRKLTVSSDRLEYVVVEQGSTGFLGFNAKPAIIKAKVKSSIDDVAKNFLNELFEKMNLSVVTEIDYNLTRVKAPNTDDSYYYVPAIVLYGTVEYHGKKSGIVQEIDSDFEPYTLLILNAVDGSVIETGNE